jgi:hypothetical protein
MNPELTLASRGDGYRALVFRSLTSGCKVGTVDGAD